MTEGVVVALIGVAGAALGLLSAWMVRVNGRIRRLESRDRLNWVYIQRLILHANTHAPEVPLPDPPEGWIESD